MTFSFASGAVILDAITTTRLSGKVNRDKLTALSGAIVEIGRVQTDISAASFVMRRLVIK